MSTYIFIEQKWQLIYGGKISIIHRDNPLCYVR